MSNKLLQEAKSAFEDTERQHQLAIWRRIGQYIVPSQNNGFREQRSPGDKKMRLIYDNVGVLANRDFANILYDILSSSSHRFAEFEYSDDTLNNRPDTKEFLNRSINILYDRLRDSNFYKVAARNFKTFCGFGNMVLLINPTEEKALKFSSIHLSRVAFTEDEFGDVTKLYVRLEYTPEQAVAKFGGKVSREVAQAVQNAPESRFSYYLIIKKRDKYKKRRTMLETLAEQDRMFSGTFVEECSGNTMEETGYYEQPFAVSRFELGVGEKYGFGPGHVALPDVLQANTFARSQGKAVDLASDPPILMSQRAIFNTPNIRPGSRVIVKEIDGIAPLKLEPRFDVTELAIEKLYSKINRAFFLDKLQLPPREEIGEMTTLEVNRRMLQGQKVLSPLVTSIGQDYLQVTLVRVFNILLRNGEFGEVPQALKDGIDLKINFVNQMAKTQQAEEVNNILGWLEDGTMIAQATGDISVMDAYNKDAIVSYLGKVRSVPESMKTPEKDIKAARQQRAQQQQRAQAIEEGIAQADIQSKTRRV